MIVNKEFILLLKDGDEFAFTELINLYNRKLFAYALSLSGDHAIAKDIVQEVFIKTFEFRKKLDPKYSIEGFLMRCTFNKFINLYHQNKKMTELNEHFLITLRDVIEEAEDKEEFANLVSKMEKAINKLPQKCKEIFELSKKHGYTNKEISQTLGIAVKTVERQITIAYKKLYKSLKPYY